MEKWYELDTTWTVFNVKNREDYVNRYIVPGRFHTGVPEDVVKAYETAEHLMALAWYHYPMYDEALKKLLGILEMAIKLRCQQMGVELKFVNNKKGTEETYKLSVLIDKLCSLEKKKDLKHQLHKVRELRNTFAHPERHSFAGGIFQRPIIPLVNILNMMFLETANVVAAEEQLAHLEQDFIMFQQGLFILEKEGKRLLITKAVPHQMFDINGNNFSCWSIIPVLNNAFDFISQHRYSPPIIFLLTDIQLKGSTLTAKEFKTDNAVSIYENSNTLDQEKLTQHLNDWERLTIEDQALYRNYIINETARMISKYQYQYSWAQSDI